MTQWFAFGERDEVEQSIEIMKDLGIRELRTLFSWADWRRPGGKEWFDWFVGRLVTVPGIRLLPCLFYTPLDLSRKDKKGKAQTSYPPKNTALYAKFVGEMIDRYGHMFDWIQLWNEPNWKPYWDDAMDPDWDLLVAMLRPAADVARAKGKKVALGGTAPLELPWFVRMEEKGLIEKLDAVAFHYAPSWPNQHRRWFSLETEIHGFRALMKGLGRDVEVWLDETGISTLTPYEPDTRKLEKRQMEFFKGICRVSAERVYWFSILDQRDDCPTDDMLNVAAEKDVTAYHFGIVRLDGSKKPLYGLWKKLSEKKTASSRRKGGRARKARWNLSRGRIGQ